MSVRYDSDEHGRRSFYGAVNRQFTNGVTSLRSIVPFGDACTSPEHTSRQFPLEASKTLMKNWMSLPFLELSWFTSQASGVVAASTATNFVALMSDRLIHPTFSPQA